MHGVVVQKGVPGLVVLCGRRSEADRIRRVVRAHLARGGRDGGRTLESLADLAYLMEGASTATVLAAFDAAAAERRR